MWVHADWLARGVLAAMSGEAEGDCGWEGAPANRDAAFAPLGVPAGSIHLLRQVHGTGIHEALQGASPAQSKADAVEADAWITSSPGYGVGILVADCVPVWIIDVEARVGAVIHAGREGTYGDIVGATVARIVKQWGRPPDRLEAYIGPSAGPCCYEVSEAMAEAWRLQGLVAAGRKLDLWQTNRAQLERAGVPSFRIGAAQHCTICMGGYHSFRRSGSHPRNLALLRMAF